MPVAGIGAELGPCSGSAPALLVINLSRPKVLVAALLLPLGGFNVPVASEGRGEAPAINLSRPKVLGAAGGMRATELSPTRCACKTSVQDTTQSRTPLLPLGGFNVPVAGESPDTQESYRPG